MSFNQNLVEKRWTFVRENLNFKCIFWFIRPRKVELQMYFFYQNVCFFDQNLDDKSWISNVYFHQHFSEKSGIFNVSFNQHLSKKSWILDVFFYQHSSEKSWISNVFFDKNLAEKSWIWNVSFDQHLVKKLNQISIYMNML